MKHARRIALMAFLIAIAVIIAIGFYRAVAHQESRPAGNITPARATSTAR